MPNTAARVSDHLRKRITDPTLAAFVDVYRGIETVFESHALQGWLEHLPDQILTGLSMDRWGDLLSWLQHWAALPAVTACQADFTSSAVSLTGEQALAPNTLDALHQALMGLHPWRKGPFDFFGIHVDTEWRSNLKWSRLAPHIDLRQKRVLDVGCGNGYYGWRMLGAGAREVLGIDPSPRFVLQWACVRHYCPEAPCFVIPIGIESVPNQLNHFDVTFSMGVLYHRKSPFEHLYQLKDTLKPGGQLVLETLVIPGTLGETLLPAARYGKMRNVWLLPSVATLVSWLQRCGFTNINTADVSETTTHEQRQTPWMRFESLADFLDPENTQQTIEGYPAPTRAILIAQKPA
ncbi:MAG: tRNA 5-methoxyuridine(34)/uridine 5-oxyacetic acid(34) synthase CmoB [Gammaproteobacteria bacterium]